MRSRLDRVPRYRQKLAYPPAGIGRPRWIDDPHFNLEYHVRHIGLPSPGDEPALRRIVARQFSQRLDRSKPLWELAVVEGLAGDRFALITKTHHAVVDGVSGVDIAAALLDREPRPLRTEGTAPWVARPEPTAAELAAAAVNGNIRDVARLPVRALGAVAGATRLRQAAQTLARSAPASPLNVKIGPHRRVALVQLPLEDFKRVKNVFGGSVNDVVVAIVSGAIRTWMHSRGLRTDGVELRAAVPVSLQNSDEDGEGTRIIQVVAPVPVDLADPVARLRLVQGAMTGLKESRQALSADAIGGTQGFASPTILAQSMRADYSTRPYNLLITNIPGPQDSLYLLGRELQELYPLAFLAGDRALAIAVMSYHGTVGVGLVADFDKVPDLDVIADGLRSSLGEYAKLAARRRRRSRGPATGST